MKKYILALITLCGFYSFGKTMTYDCKLNQFNSETSSFVQIDGNSFTLVNFPENGGGMELEASTQAQASVGTGVIGEGDYAISATIQFGSLSDSVTAWATIGSPIELATRGVHLKCVVK